MSKFYRPDVFENTFRYHSQLVILLFAARRGTKERRWARHWHNRISALGQDGCAGRAHRLLLVHDVLYSEDCSVVQDAWKMLGQIPGFLSVEELKIDPWGYRQFYLQWYADNADRWSLEPALVKEPLLDLENSSIRSAIIISGCTAVASADSPGALTQAVWDLLPYDFR